MEPWSPKTVREKPPSNDEIKYGAKASKIIIAKTIAAFLNKDGGNLVIGIFENKNDNQNDHIIGIERDYAYLEDRCTDGYQRMIIDSILKPFLDRDFFPHFSKFISIEFEKVQGKTVCWIKVKKSEALFLLNSGKRRCFLFEPVERLENYVENARFWITSHVILSDYSRLKILKEIQTIDKHPPGWIRRFMLMIRGSDAPRRMG